MIRTKRFHILPLSVAQLELYVREDNSLITELNVNNIVWDIPKSLRKTILNKIIPAINQNGNDLLFSTFWTIIELESNCMVGDLCFKGNPNELGEVEIGYGIHSEFHNNGFMTEAVGGIIQWTFEQENVNCIWAETVPQNLASQKVLLKNDFEQIDVTEMAIYWRILKK